MEHARDTKKYPIRNKVRFSVFKQGEISGLKHLPKSDQEPVSIIFIDDVTCYVPGFEIILLLISRRPKIEQVHAWSHIVPKS